VETVEGCKRVEKFWARLVSIRDLTFDSDSGKGGRMGSSGMKSAVSGTIIGLKQHQREGLQKGDKNELRHMKKNGHRRINTGKLSSNN